MAFVSFHAIEEFLGIPPIPFHYDGLYPFTDAPKPPFFAKPSRNRNNISGETPAERKRILTNNIFGVDIDPQAAEMTKLSLLLKVLEGESEQTLSSQFKLFHERALPDLGGNIKCGNSRSPGDWIKLDDLRK